MAHTYPTNAIDRLMAQLSGNVSPLWLTILLKLGSPPPLAVVQAVVHQLMRETECLNVVWMQGKCHWERYKWSAEDIEKIVKTKVYEKNQDVTEDIINSPVDLTREPPIRVWLVFQPPAAYKASSHILALQVHHAFCDGRALFALTRRFGQILEGMVTGNVIKALPLQKSDFIDSKILRYTMQHWRKLGAFFSPSYYQFSKRAIGLKKSGSQIERSIIRTIRVPIHPNAIVGPEERSALIFETILAAVYAHGFDPLTKGKFIRLRIPVDLRPSLKISQNVIGNLCSAVPVEIPIITLEGLYKQGNLMLGKMVIEQIKSLIKNGAHLTTLMECLLIPYLISPKSLRENVRKEFLASTRTSTLVISTGGNVDRYLKPLEIFGLQGIQLHSGTWGTAGCLYQDAFFISISCFEDIWTPKDINNFSASMLNFCNERYGFQGEMI